MVSLLIIVSVMLVTAASFSVQSTLLGRGSLDRHSAGQAEMIAYSLLYDSIQNYMRFGAGWTNPYPDWTTGCLQEADWMCKMETSLNDSGGTIGAWGQYGGKIKHFQATLTVDNDGRIMLSGVEEQY